MGEMLDKCANAYSITLVSHHITNRKKKPKKYGVNMCVKTDWCVYEQDEYRK